MYIVCFDILRINVSVMICYSRNSCAIDVGLLKLAF